MSEEPFEFGGWRVEPARGLLAPIGDGVGGGGVHIEPRLMDLLLLFAGSAGRVLSKSEIIDGVWGGRAVGDDTLAAAVSRLRRALGETPERRFIETLPKRGYRLILTRSTEGRGGARAAPEAPAKAAALVAQGRAAMAAPFAAGQAQARLYFEAAVREAPGWAPAHVGLAEALAAQHLSGQGGAGLLAAAKASGHAAVGLDANLARAWAVLGLVTLLADRSFAAADEALRRAVALDPDLATAHAHRALAFAATGQFVEAERESRRSVELEPVSLQARGGLLQILLTARRYRQAVAAANEVLALSPLASEAWYAKGWAQVLSGDAEDGRCLAAEGPGALGRRRGPHRGPARGPRHRGLCGALRGGRRPVRDPDGDVHAPAHRHRLHARLRRPAGQGLRRPGGGGRPRRSLSRLPAVAALLRPAARRSALAAPPAAGSPGALAPIRRRSGSSKAPGP
jgi:DNA-binding winged helix-turn-helix (wHTH) protein